MKHLLLVIAALVCATPGNTMSIIDTPDPERQAIIVDSRKEKSARAMLVQQCTSLTFADGEAVVVFKKVGDGIPNEGHPLAPGTALAGGVLRLRKRSDTFHITTDNVTCTFVVRKLDKDVLLLAYQWEEADKVVAVTLIDRGDFTIRSEDVRQ